MSSRRGWARRGRRTRTRSSSTTQMPARTRPGWASARPPGAVRRRDREPGARQGVHGGPEKRPRPGRRPAALLRLRDQRAVPAVQPAQLPATRPAGLARHLRQGRVQRRIQAVRRGGRFGVDQDGACICDHAAAAGGRRRKSAGPVYQISMQLLCAGERRTAGGSAAGRRPAKTGGSSGLEQSMRPSITRSARPTADVLPSWIR
jgi:hypothetical protein